MTLRQTWLNSYLPVLPGDFKTRSYLAKNANLSAPSDQLTAIDYLSHASRVIIDYSELSSGNKLALARYFLSPSRKNKVVSRSATHAVTRVVNGEIKELKGFMLGIIGPLPALIKTPNDFGVNIAMGGHGQKNFAGKKISANGYSGHMYFHHDPEQNLAMVGLEQCAPQSSVLSVLWGHQASSTREQSGTDQFGQGHSLVGASDTYTAAGSLYFSDPVYQAKLFVEKGCFPPDKYNGMQVKLTDENWLKIRDYLLEINKNINSYNWKFIQEQLMQKPVTARSKKQEVLSYIALDFSTYLKQIYDVFIDDSDLVIQEKSNLKILQDQLLSEIKKLQDGSSDSYKQFVLLLQQISAFKNVPIPYIVAIQRIDNLFKHQLSIDPALQKTQQDVLLQNQHEELQIQINELIQQIILVQQYFQSDYIANDSYVKSYQLELTEQLERLQSTVKQSSNKLATSSSNFGVQSWLFSEQLVVTVETLEEQQKCIAQTEALLKRTPKLYSEEAVKEEVKKQLARANEQNHTLQADLEIKETQLILAEEKKKFVEVERASAIAEEEPLKETNRELVAKNDISIERMLRVAPILNNVNEIKKKAIRLKERGYEYESGIAQELADYIMEEIKTYALHVELGNEAAALQKFKDNCTDYIDNLLINQPILARKRGWGLVLHNVLVAISVLGVGYPIALFTNKKINGHYLFFGLSDSGQKVGTLKKNVGVLEAPATDESEFTKERPILVMSY